ncbi:ABC transporter substrate-binding protein [Kineosporia sp. J2-2]|uniref:ABC transporter substrate-binding protein n=1 Tax=Kineosporia corallincola TaxID=2835133 RepID=A0ABS5TCX1_9ACTN|nr:ABC transporter substrate-binding protein [Kineosporia corallincola]MBT0768698.1 ABC transporter substrate-binding protein [Kineosporia corallincola]
MRIRRPATLGAAAVAAMALALTGCSSGSGSTGTAASSDAGQPVAGGDLTIARTGQNVSDLDPVAETLTSNNAYTLDKIFDTLVTQDGDGQLQPSLATEWETSSDGLTWTFTLRDGVKFSNGDALTAKDVVYSIERHLKVGGALPLSAPIKTVKAVNDTTVEITLKTAYTPLATELATFASSIVPDDLDGKSATEFFADPVGTGPFKVGTWDKNGSSFELVKNDNYWQTGKPYLNSVTYTTVSDDNSLVQQLQGQQVDVITDVPPANVAALKANTALSVDTVGSFNQDEVFFNTSTGPFADRDLRRAVAQAVDRASLTATTTFGTGTTGTTYIPANVRYSDQNADVLKYDVAAAKADLEKAGAAGTTVTLLVESGSQTRGQQAQIIQDALKQIGLTVEIKQQDSATFWTTFPAKDYEFALTTVIADTGDPDNITYWQVDSNGVSDSFHTGYQNAEVDKLAAQGRETPDGDERKGVYEKIQDLVSQDSPTLSLDYAASIAATQANVHGLELIPNGTVQLQDAWIAK